MENISVAVLAASMVSPVCGQGVLLMTDNEVWAGSLETKTDFGKHPKAVHRRVGYIFGRSGDKPGVRDTIVGVQPCCHRLIGLEQHRYAHRAIGAAKRQVEIVSDLTIQIEHKFNAHQHMVQRNSKPRAPALKPEPKRSSPRIPAPIVVEDRLSLGQDPYDPLNDSVEDDESLIAVDARTP